MNSHCWAHNQEQKEKRGESRLLFWFLFAGIFMALYGSVFLVSRGTVVLTATPPSIINYQGKLLRDGASVTTAQNMGFLLFDASTNGNLLYTAAGTLAATTTLSITPTSGIFSVDLGTGSTNAIPTSTFANNHTIYLEVHVGGATLSPRKRITAVPYAINSEYLSGLSATTTSGTEYIPRANEYGNFLFTGTPRGSTVGDGLVYLNPTSSIDNFTLLGVAVGGTQLFRVDEDGDTFIAGGLFVTNTITAGSLNATGNINASSTLFINGTINSLGSDTEIRTSAFDNALYISDSNRRVGIGTSTPFATLSVSTTAGTPAFVIGSSTATYLIVDSNGKLGLNTTTPSDTLAVSGTVYIVGTTTITNQLFVPGKATRPGYAARTTTGISGYSQPSDVAIHGNYAYVVNNKTGSDYLLVVNIQDPYNPVVVSSVSLGSSLPSLADVEVSGNFVYTIGNNSDRLIVVNVSNPASPAVASVFLHGTGGANFDGPLDMAIQGKFAYIAGNVSDSLEVVDISDPYNPRHVTAVNIPGAAAGARSVAISGSYLYLTKGSGTPQSDAGLYIYDISNPSAPYLRGSILDNATTEIQLDDPRGIDIRGNYAYVTNEGVVDALNIINVTNPASPQLSTTTYDDGYGALMTTPSAIVVAGRYAYIAANSDNVLTVFDVSSSTNPIHMGRVDGLGGPTSVAINGNYIVTTPGSAIAGSVLDTIDISGSDISNAAIGALKAGYLQVMNRSTFDQFLDVRGGALIANGLSVSGDLGLAVPTASTTATNTISFSHRAHFIASSSIGQNAYILDTSSTMASNLDFLSVRNNGTNLFVVNSSGGFLSFGSSTVAAGLNVQGALNASSSLFVNSAITVNQTAGTYDLGRFYVDSDGNLSASGTVRFSGSVGIGSSTPSVALSIGTTSTPGQVYITGTTTIEDVAFLKGKVMRPRHVGNIADSANVPLGSPVDVAVSGHYAYVAGNTDDSLVVIDVSNPQALRPLTSTSTEQYLDGVQSVAVAGNYVYTAANTVGNIAVWDVSNPAKLTFVTSTPQALVRSVAVQGNYLYAVAPTVAGNNNFFVYNISDPRNPTLVSITSIMIDPGYVTVSGRYAYVTSAASGNGNFNIIDISDPTRPMLVSTLTDTTNFGIAQTMAVQGQYAYIIGNTNSRFSIVDVSNPWNPVIVTSTRTASNLGFTIDRPNGVTVAGHYAYIANTLDGALPVGGTVQIIDITSSTRPVGTGIIRHSEGGASLDGPFRIAVSGNYAYVAASNGNAFEVLDIGGANISNAEIGSARVGTLRVLNYGTFDNGVSIRNGLTIGNNGLAITGDFGMNAPSSSAYLVNATNTLRFSHKAHFMASSSNGDNFIFDAISTSSGANNIIFSIRDNGTKLFSVSSTGDVRIASRLFAASATVGTPGNPGDVAERIDISQDDLVEAGDVVMLDSTSQSGLDLYRRSRTAYEPLVAGVISTNPTLTVGSGRTSLTAPLALSGRVPVKISTENGPILRGDLLVSASRPGQAMRYSARTAPTSTPAAIIGMALESSTSTAALDGATTTERIMMLVGLSRLSPADAPLVAADAPLLSTSTAAVSEGEEDEPESVGELLQGNAQMSLDTQNLVVRNAEFHGSIVVRGHAVFGGDVVGQARIKEYENEVRVVFAEEYTRQPIITVTPRGNAAALDFRYAVKDESTTGFTIKIEPWQATAVEFNWHAFGAESGRIYVSDGTREDIRIVAGGGVSQQVEAAPAAPDQSASSTDPSHSTSTQSSEAIEEIAPPAETTSTEPVASEVAVEAPATEPSSAGTAPSPPPEAGTSGVVTEPPAATPPDTVAAEPVPVESPLPAPAPELSSSGGGEGGA